MNTEEEADEPEFEHPDQRFYVATTPRQHIEAQKILEGTLIGVRTPDIISGLSLAKLYSERDELLSKLELSRATIQARKLTLAAVRANRDQLRAALTELLPFVLEDCHPTCATPAYKHAVERAKAITNRD